jgi:membrane protein implicated in regulation of membrane protease activity
MLNWFQESDEDDSSDHAPKAELTNDPSHLVTPGEAVVSVEIRPHCKGRVRFKGTWWPARCDQSVVLMPGETVNVVGIEAITLVVEPCYQVEPTATYQSA